MPSLSYRGPGPGRWGQPGGGMFLELGHPGGRTADPLFSQTAKRCQAKTNVSFITRLDFHTLGGTGGMGAWAEEMKTLKLSAPVGQNKSFENHRPFRPSARSAQSVRIESPITNRSCAPPHHSGLLMADGPMHAAPGPSTHPRDDPPPWGFPNSSPPSLYTEPSHSTMKI